MDYQFSWDFGFIKKSADLGVNWLSPVGPLRLVWGYNLDKQKGDEDAQWDLQWAATSDLNMLIQGPAEVK